MQETRRTPDHRITAVLFDMDNTLFDFVGAKIAACDAVNRRLGLDRGRDLLFYFLRHDGRSFEDWGHIRDFMVDNAVFSEDLYAECCAIYEEVKVQNLIPYPHIEETLLELKEQGLFLSVVTDACFENAVIRLEKTGLFPIFDEVITADMTGAHKPDPKVFLLALEKMGRQPSEVLMVGDSLRRDIGPAKKLGMMTAYAGYGDRNFLEDRQKKADVTLADIREVLKVVNGKNGV
ncbi:MAG TPA: HAD family hydrolase [Methanolinea sp.]|nr:HAD family hydrolase [Methanolinea sp.]HQK56093.1 HAD family hydrolase [Methanolinea sp.]